MRRVLPLTRAAGGLVVAAVVLTTAALAAPGASERLAREGGTFSVGVRSGVFDAIDPALADVPPEFQLLSPACASLMAYPNKPPPEGLRLGPELAEAEPVVSRNGRTYTFTIREDARFSNGVRVTARDFASTIARVLDPDMDAPGASNLATILVGGDDVLAGKTTVLRGVVAAGRKLTLRLTKRVADLLSQTASLCVVPASLSTGPEGAIAPLPSPAPYYVAEYVPGERLVLERNRFYRGRRPHHVDRIVADFVVDAGVIIDEIASGKLHFGVGVGGALQGRAGELRQRYGVNKSQFFVVPGTGHRMFVLNASRPLFRNNPKLRQAVNFAVDRRALIREHGVLTANPTDQYLSSAQRGYKDEHIYPLERPDLRAARALTKGNLRSGKAVFYTTDSPTDVAEAQVLQRSLRAIGLELEIVQFPGPLIFEKLATEGHKFDIGRIVWFPSPDPSGSAASSTGGRSANRASRTGRTSARRNTTACSTRPRGSGATNATALTARWTFGSRETPRPRSPFRSSMHTHSSPPGSAASSSTRCST